MRGFIRSVISVLAAVALCVPAIAQSSATGIIRGKVQNATNGAFLENATVEIEGTNRIAVTNGYGEFEFRGVPVGEVTLKAGYIGQPTQTATVTVTDGGEATQDFTFRGAAGKDGVVQLDPYTVNVERYQNARAIAIAEERTSVNIKNVVSIDQFGDIPSNNVGEFVKFLPGIQIEYGASNGNNQGYSDSNANGVSVRGFGPEDTSIMIDGLPVASTVPGNLTRQVGLDQLAINNASRVELIKVATPDVPANSLGGQINLVTRSAFEFPKPTYSARLFFNINSQHTDFGKTPGPTNKDTYKTQPGVEFSVTYPFSRKLGVSFTGFAGNEFTQSYRGQPVWNNNHAANFQNGAIVDANGKASSLAHPVLTRYQITDSARIVETRSGNLKLDWKPTPSQILRANVQFSTYGTTEGVRRLDFRPTIANGATWNEFQSIGTTANSTTAMTVTTRDRIGETTSGQLQYQLNLGGWNISAAGSISVSESEFEDEGRGHYSEIALNLNPGRVALYLGENGNVRYAETYTRGTNQVARDYTQLANWVFDGTTAKSGESRNETLIALYKVDVERDLSFLPFLGSNTLTLKTGFRHDEDTQEKSGRGTGYREILRPGASYTVADVLDEAYLGQSPGFGLPAQQWASTYRLYELEKANDIFYEPDIDESTNTRVENYNSFVGQQKKIKESTDAWYAQLSGRFFKNRLSFVGGLRQETKTREGYSPFTDPKWDYVKRADGSLYSDAANPNGVQFSVGNGSVLNGVLITAPTNRPLYANTAAGTALRAALTSAGIAFPAVPYGPTTGANASLASRMLQFQPARPVYAKRKGDPSYSLSAAYNLTKKIDVKLAWSRSFGLPKLEDAEFGLLSGTSNFSINDFTATEEGSNGGALGEIRIANPNIKPSISDNWDAEVSYFTDSGGKLSVSYYYKTITSQPITLTTFYGSTSFNEVLPVLGLDPEEFVDWRLATSTNADTKQTKQGWEFEIRQDFGFLGDWGKHFQGFLSYSFDDLGEPPTLVPVTLPTPNGSTLTVTPSARFIVKRANKFGGAGLQFSGRRFTAQVRGTYRNDNEIQPSVSTAVATNIVRRYQPAETRIDVNLAYSINKTYSAFVSARDVLNGSRKEIARDELGQLAPYAQVHDYREFGTVWTVGVSGKW